MNQELRNEPPGWAPGDSNSSALCCPYKVGGPITALWQMLSSWAREPQEVRFTWANYIRRQIPSPRGGPFLVPFLPKHRRSQHGNAILPLRCQRLPPEVGWGGVGVGGQEQMCVQVATSYPNGEVAHTPRSHCSLRGKSVREHWHLGAQEGTTIMATWIQWPLVRSEIRSLTVPQERAMATLWVLSTITNTGCIFPCV